MSRITNRHPQWVKPPPEVKRRIQEEKRMAEQKSWADKQAAREAKEDAREVRTDEILSGIADLLQGRKLLLAERDEDGTVRYVVVDNA